MWCLLNKTCVKTAIFSKHYANVSWVVSLLLAKYVMLTEHILSLEINYLLYQENSFYPKWKPYFARSLYFFPKTHLIISEFRIRRFLLPPYQSAVLIKTSSHIYLFSKFYEIISFHVRHAMKISDKEYWKGTLYCNFLKILSLTAFQNICE